MKLARVAVLTALLAWVVVPALAAEESFEGTLVCAKCYLKKADAKECQDVLLVKSSDGKQVEYYITKNDVGKHQTCTAQVKAKVTGTLSEKDGKTWLTPSKIEKM